MIATLTFWGLIGFCFLAAWIYTIASKNELRRHEREIYMMKYEQQQHQDNTGAPDKDDTCTQPVHTQDESNY